jgi:hypothetical protein
MSCHCCPIWTKTGQRKQIFVKLAGAKFNGSSLSTSRVVTCIQADGQTGWETHITDMAKRIGTLLTTYWMCHLRNCWSKFEEVDVKSRHWKLPREYSLIFVGPIQQETPITFRPCCNTCLMVQQMPYFLNTDDNNVYKFYYNYLPI